MGLVGFGIGMAIGAAIAFTLIGVQPRNDGSDLSLEMFVSKQPIGFGADVWLVQSSMIDEQKYDKIALVFGVLGDMEICQQLVQALSEEFPNSYKCVTAN